MADLLRGLDCKVWVDDAFYFTEDEISLLCLLDEILGWLESVGFFVAAHKCTFFARKLVWCGNVYCDGDRSHEPLAFLSGAFKGSQLRWATVDNKGFAIVPTRFTGWNTCFGVGFISLQIIAISRTLSTPKRA